jgi:uncharacterized 2Fe-2S/4Fe-4S cluster protein (DUF4445 family)
VVGGMDRCSPRRTGAGRGRRPELKKLEVTYRPSGKTVRVPEGTSLFHAAHWGGLPIESTCGGRGTCGKCKVRIIDGVADVTPHDTRELSPDLIEQGWRLSCQALVSVDTECEVPALMKKPKAATMGVGRFVLLEPNVWKVHVQLDEPTLEDPRSDFQRLHDALDTEGYPVEASLPVLRGISRKMRDAGYDVTAALSGEHLVDVEEGDTSHTMYGIAVDVGTTTVVTTLMNLDTGMADLALSDLNRQARFGGDVISRMAMAMRGLEAIEELRMEIVDTINDLISELLSQTGVERHNVYEMVVVGNATMLHLLLGVDPHPIALSPFVAAFLHPLDLSAEEAGVDIHPQGRVQTFPSLGAYIGADIISDVLATGLAREDKLRLLVDVGTNGEIVLGSADRLIATSAPAGPAFEGAEIKCGMRASEGAIEGIVLSDHVELQVIGGDARPAGLCGSGLIDAVAQLRASGILDATGKMLSREEAEAVDHPLASHLIVVDEIKAFEFAEGVYLSQVDVRELQSAKGSVATGITALMETMGVSADDLDEVLLAGSFGTYINPASAVIVGLVPPVPVERIRSVGNAAGEGAKMALLSFREREIAMELPQRIEYLELSGYADFNERFMRALAFPDLQQAQR